LRARRTATSVRPQSIRKGGVGECCWVRSVRDLSCGSRHGRQRRARFAEDLIASETAFAARCVRGVEAGSWRQPRVTWSMLLHSPPARGRCGASKEAVPKGRGVSGELTPLDVERGDPSGVQPGVECLASARCESWLHRSRRHIYHCSPSKGGSRGSLLSWPGRVSGNTLARRRSRAVIRT
jgi:hypothetical protein